MLSRQDTLVNISVIRQMNSYLQGFLQIKYGSSKLHWCLINVWWVVQFSKALNRFQKEDPTFRVSLDPDSGQVSACYFLRLLPLMQNTQMQVSYLGFDSHPSIVLCLSSLSSLVQTVVIIQRLTYIVSYARQSFQGWVSCTLISMLSESVGSTRSLFTSANPISEASKF